MDARGGARARRCARIAAWSGGALGAAWSGGALGAAGAGGPSYCHRVTWASEYVFSEPFLDLRHEHSQAEDLQAELAKELSSGHLLHGLALRVIARALPQDDVVVQSADGTVALVHLTWSGQTESAPWPTTEVLRSAEHFEQTTEFRY